MAKMTQLTLGIPQPKVGLTSHRADKRKRVHFAWAAPNGKMQYGCGFAELPERESTDEPALVTCAACTRWLCEHVQVVNQLVGEKKA